MLLRAFHSGQVNNNVIILLANMTEVEVFFNNTNLFVKERLSSMRDLPRYSYLKSVLVKKYMWTGSRVI